MFMKIASRKTGKFLIFLEGVVAQWCNPRTLQPEQSGGVISIPDRTQGPHHLSVMARGRGLD